MGSEMCIRDRLFRKAGQFVGKIKGMAREFSRAMNNAADDVGVSDISSTIRSAANPLKSSVDAVKNAATDYRSYDPETETGELAGKRAEQAKKIKEHSEKKAQEKLDKSADKNLADNLPKKGKSSKGKKNVSSDKLENS